MMEPGRYKPQRGPLKKGDRAGVVERLLVDYFRQDRAHRSWREFRLSVRSRIKDDLAANPRRTRSLNLWIAAAAILSALGSAVVYLLTGKAADAVVAVASSFSWLAVVSMAARAHIGTVADMEGAARNSFGIPNGLSFLRVALAPFPVLLAGPALESEAARWLLVVLVTALVLSDFFDGQLARALGWITRFGQALDPMADIIMLASLTLALFAADGLTPALFTLLLIRYPGLLLLASVLYVLKGPFEVKATSVGRYCSGSTAVGMAILFAATFELLPAEIDKYVHYVVWSLYAMIGFNLVYLLASYGKLTARLRR